MNIIPNKGFELTKDLNNSTIDVCKEHKFRKGNLFTRTITVILQNQEKTSVCVNKMTVILTVPEMLSTGENILIYLSENEKTQKLDFFPENVRKNERPNADLIIT